MVYAYTIAEQSKDEWIYREVSLHLFESTPSFTLAIFSKSLDPCYWGPFPVWPKLDHPWDEKWEKNLIVPYNKCINLGLCDFLAILHAYPSLPTHYLSFSTFFSPSLHFQLIASPHQPPSKPSFALSHWLDDGMWKRSPSSKCLSYMSFDRFPAIISAYM